MHTNKIFVLIFSILLALVHDDRITRRNVIVDRSSIIAIAFHSSWYGNRLRAFLTLSLGKLGPCAADEILSIFYGLFTGRFPEDVVLLESFIDQRRNDRLDILKVRIKYDILCSDSLLRVEHEHFLKQKDQTFTARFQ